MYVKVNMYKYVELKVMESFRRPISEPEASRRVRFPDFERVKYNNVILDRKNA